LELNYGKKGDVQLVETIELFVGARVLQEREDFVVFLVRKPLPGNNPLPVVSIGLFGLNDG
jgi:hypothetical protein